MLILRTSPVLQLACSLGVLIPSSPCGAQCTGRTLDAAAHPADGAFLENAGQWRPEVAFLRRFGALDVRGVQHGLALALHADAESAAHGLRITLENASDSARWIGVRTVETADTHWVVGPRARTVTPRAYERMVLSQVRPGVDLVVHDVDGDLEYDLVLAPEADLEQLTFRVEGATSLHLHDTGALRIDTPAGMLRQSAPRTFSLDEEGRRAAVASRCVLRGDGRFGFAVPDWDRERPIVVDPGLVFSTLYGGRSIDGDARVGHLRDGTAVIAGRTTSNDLPVTAGSIPYRNGDLFLARLSADGSTVLAATYFGGSGREYQPRMSVAGDDSVYLAGSTESIDLPTTAGGFQPAAAGGLDAFVARFDGATLNLTWSTYLGGSAGDTPHAVAATSSGVVIGGTTLSTDFPLTVGAFETSNAFQAAFVTHLDGSGTALLGSSYYGGGDARNGSVCLDVDAAPDGSLAFCGNAAASASTTPNRLPGSGGGSSQPGFVARFSADCSQLLYGTFYNAVFGGTSITGVEAAPDGALVVCGSSDPGLPTTTGAFDRSSGGGFVARIAPAGNALEFATFLAASRSRPSAITLLPDERVAVAAVGPITGTAGAFEPTANGFTLAAVLLVSRNGDDLHYATYLGGGAPTSGDSIDAMEDGSVLFGGSIFRTPFSAGGVFPTTPNAWRADDGNYESEAFISRLDLLPSGVTRYGTATSGCDGDPILGVDELPAIGASGFTLVAGRASPGLPGAVALTLTPLGSPFPLAGAALWVDPSTELLVDSVLARPDGTADYPLPIPNDPTLRGGRLFTQMLFLSPTNPAPCPPGGLSATTALEIVLQ